jgi:hypothetical protein
VLQRRRGRRGHGWRPWSGGVEEVGWGRRRATSSLGRARGEARPLAWRKRRAQRQQTVARVEALVRRRGGTERHERSKEGEIFRPRALGQYIWMEHHYRDKARTGSDESHHCRCKGYNGSDGWNHCRCYTATGTNEGASVNCNATKQKIQNNYKYHKYHSIAAVKAIRSGPRDPNSNLG